MNALVTAASKPERAGIKPAFQNLMQRKRQVARLYLVWADGGYSGQLFLRWAMDTFRLVVEVVLRPQQSKGFVLLKKQANLWLVELVPAAQPGL